MSNMSYCRFRNTEENLEECIDAISKNDDITVEEANAGKRMFKSILSYCRTEGIIEDYDSDAVDNLFNSMIGPF